jgi:hypothetical protein
MIDMLKRHEIQVLRRAGHSQFEVADLAGVSRRTVQRVDVEAAVTDIDTARARETRGIGRPPKAEPFRTTVAEILAGEPELRSVEILRRAKLKEYAGGKTALYALIRERRPKTIRPLSALKAWRESFRNTISGTSTSAFSMGPSSECTSSRVG